MLLGATPAEPTSNSEEPAEEEPVAQTDSQNTSAVEDGAQVQHEDHVPHSTTDPEDVHPAVPVKGLHPQSPGSPTLPPARWSRRAKQPSRVYDPSSGKYVVRTG